jgi:hypothetical protein
MSAEVLSVYDLQIKKKQGICTFLKTEPEIFKYNMQEVNGQERMDELKIKQHKSNHAYCRYEKFI